MLLSLIWFGRETLLEPRQIKIPKSGSVRAANGDSINLIMQIYEKESRNKKV